jgi:beta-hydroxylase
VAGRAAQKVMDLATVALFVLLVPVQMLMHRFSRVGDRPFFDKAQFPWAPDIESGWQEVRGELDHVLRFVSDIPNFQDISEENRPLTDDDRWKTFFFRAWGREVASNCARCPRTAALLDRIPGATSAFFSILMPRKHLPPHRGPYAGVLRYHLGLLVPDPQGCRIRVGSEVGHWREGGSLIFDDTFEHEVWNDTDAVRVVLFVDILRPLPWPLAAVNAAVISLIARSSLVKPGLEKFEAWDERLRRVWR